MPSYIEPSSHDIVAGATAPDIVMRVLGASIFKFHVAASKIWGYQCW